jgi:hypothetical protein
MKKTLRNRLLAAMSASVISIILASTSIAQQKTIEKQKIDSTKVKMEIKQKYDTTKVKSKVKHDTLSKKFITTPPPIK